VTVRTPAPPAGAVSVDLEAAFYETDPMCIVWHGHYLAYMDRARTALMRARRLDGEELVALGYRFVVIESHVRHVHALRYGDRFRVSAWCAEAENRILVRYEVRDLGRDRVAATGETALAALTAAGTLCLEVPECVRARLGPVATDPGAR
jgi:acyl-CoA thioester hydrolase